MIHDLIRVLIRVVVPTVPDVNSVGEIYWHMPGENNSTFIRSFSDIVNEIRRRVDMARDPNPETRPLDAKVVFQHVKKRFHPPYENCKGARRKQNLALLFRDLAADTATTRQLVKKITELRTRKRIKPLPRDVNQDLLDLLFKGTPAEGKVFVSKQKRILISYNLGNLSATNLGRKEFLEQHAAALVCASPSDASTSEPAPEIPSSGSPAQPQQAVDEDTLEENVAFSSVEQCLVRELFPMLETVEEVIGPANTPSLKCYRKALKDMKTVHIPRDRDMTTVLCGMNGAGKSTDIDVSAEGTWRVPLETDGLGSNFATNDNIILSLEQKAVDWCEGSMELPFTEQPIVEQFKRIRKVMNVEGQQGPSSWRRALKEAVAAKVRQMTQCRCSITCYLHSVLLDLTVILALNQQPTEDADQDESDEDEEDHGKEVFRNLVDYLSDSSGFQPGSSFIVPNGESASATTRGLRLFCKAREDEPCAIMDISFTEAELREEAYMYITALHEYKDLQETGELRFPRDPVIEARNGTCTHLHIHPVNADCMPVSLCRRPLGGGTP